MEDLFVNVPVVTTDGKEIGTARVRIKYRMGIPEPVVVIDSRFGSDFMVALSKGVFDGVTVNSENFQKPKENSNPRGRRGQKIGGISVLHTAGDPIGTAEIDYDPEASCAWIEIVVGREYGLLLLDDAKSGRLKNLLIDGIYGSRVEAERPLLPPTSAVRGGIRYGRAYVPPEYGSDGKAYEGSVPSPERLRETTRPHPHVADFDLDPNNQNLSDEEIRNRFGFHKATLEGPNATAPRHAYLRNEFTYFADMLNRVLPPGRAKSIAFERLEEASMWVHKGVAETGDVQ